MRNSYKTLLFFSVSDRGTLDRAIEEWLPQLQTLSFLVLVGTRMADSSVRAVPQAEAVAVASQHRMQYVELLLTDVEGFDAFLGDVLEVRFPRRGCVRHPRPLVQELAGLRKH